MYVVHVSICHNRVLSRIKIFGGEAGLSITVNDCHARYTHRFDACIVYVYSRVMGGGGGG